MASDPVAMTTDFASTACFSPLMNVTSTLPGPMTRPVPWKWSILCLRRRNATPSTLPLTPWILEGEHGGKVESGIDLDAHGGEAVRGFRVALARMEQRL